MADTDRVERTAVALATTTVVGVAAATGLAAAGDRWWALDLFSHFRPQYLCLLVVAGGTLAGLRHWLGAGLAAGALAINLWLVAPLYLASGPTPRAGAPRLSLIAFNVHASNRQHRAVTDYLRRADPDLVILTEVTPELAAELARSLPEHRLVSRARRDSFGIALLAHPAVLADADIESLGDGLPAVTATVRLGDRSVRVLGIHPPPPLGRRMATRRDRVLRAAADWARAQSDPVVVAGDFNASHWSHALAPLTEDAGLIDSARGHGLRLTWPRGLAPLAVPIDHCLHGRELAVLDRDTGPWLGSDHRPLHVTLTLAAD